MNKIIKISLIIFLATLALWFLLQKIDSKWSGVDETVVEKFAADAGRPSRKPFINTDQGDLLLFFFLVAGSIGGFVGGYYFRELFPPDRSSQELMILKNKTSCKEGECL